MEKKNLTAKGKGSGKGVKENHDTMVVNPAIVTDCIVDSSPITNTVTATLDTLGDTLGNESVGLASSSTVTSASAMKGTIVLSFDTSFDSCRIAQVPYLELCLMLARADFHLHFEKLSYHSDVLAIHKDNA
ncbi:hypothetical protein Tco_0400328 [Tanacetum coccineum]